MRFKTNETTVPGEYTPEGKAKVQVETIPVLPVDWQMIATRAVVGIVLTLTLVAVGWSTWSIGELLDGGIGYGAAVIYDMGWATALLLEYLARYDKNKRDFPKKLGWTLLVITMAAIFWHGYSRDSVAMGIFGAVISLVAKMMWLGVMKHINADLTDQDRDHLAHAISSAQTQAAVAQVRRTTSRIEQRAALELLAMEQERRKVAQAFGLDEADAIEPMADAKALAIEPPTLADLGKAGAVRFALAQLPDATHEEIVELLQGEDVDIDLAYVRQTISRMKPEPEAEVIELRK